MNYSGYMILYNGEMIMRERSYESVKERKELIAHWEITVPFYHQCFIQISPDIIIIEHPQYPIPHNARRYIKAHPLQSPSQLSRNLMISLPEVKQYLRKHGKAVKK